MWLPYQSTPNLTADPDLLRRRRFGVIEAAAGSLVRIRFRPYPKLVSVWHVLWSGAQWHDNSTGDRCWLYYNQPFRAPRYLAVTYFVSTGDCTLPTFHTALHAMQTIARLKNADALVFDVAHSRISNRVLARYGCEPLNHTRWHRNYIRRYYGQYPV